MIQSISLDATTGRLASASNDRMILIWDLSQRNMIKAFDEHQAELTQVSFFDNAGKLASVSWDGRLIVRNLSPFHPTPFEFDENDIYGLATDTSQTHVVMVSKNNIGLWNIDDNPIQLHRHPEDPPKDTSDEICSYRCVISVPNNGGWLVGDQQGYIRHFVRKDDRLLEVPPLRKSENREVTDLVMHPDGHRFISVGKPQPEQEAKVEIWNLDIAESQPMDLPTFAHDLLAVTIDSTGRYIAYAGDTYQTADHDPSLFIYDLNNKQRITLDHDFPRHIFELEFQPDSLALAAVGDSNTITLFNGPNWKKKNLFYGHNYYIQSIVFSENGERIISVGNEGAVRIWDIELRTAVLVLPLPNARSANRLIFLEKQKKIIAGGEKIYSWNYAPQSDTD